MTRECEWCGKLVSLKNYKRHKTTNCVYKNELGIKKSDFELLKQKRLRSTDERNDITILELKNFLTDSYNKAMNLYQRVVIDHARDPIEKIKEMTVSDSTKENYLIQWGLYTKWLKINEKVISVDSANSYIASVKGRPSTQRSKHNMLQTLLQHLIDRNIKLNRFKMRISFKPKRALSDLELRKYLEEQKEINSEDYLIQMLLIIYGLRINTIALMKIEDLEFLEAEEEDKEHFIHLPDSKTKNRRLEPITEELENLIKEHIAEDYDQDDFIFLKEGKKKNMRRRAQDLGTRINNRIKNSTALKKKANYQYTSHMFRKTKAYNIFQKGVNELKDQCRSSIGQSQGSTAIEHYIN